MNTPRTTSAVAILRQAMMTRAPLFAINNAVSLPIPLLAPVIKTVVLSSFDYKKQVEDLKLICSHLIIWMLLTLDLFVFKRKFSYSF